MRSGVTSCFETLSEVFSEKAFGQLLEILKPKGSKPEYSQDSNQKTVEELVWDVRGLY